jgi:hypothetical protein
MNDIRNTNRGNFSYTFHADKGQRLKLKEKTIKSKCTGKKLLWIFGIEKFFINFEFFEQNC